MDLSWLQVCAEGQAEGCIPAEQLLYLAVLVGFAVLLAILAVRTRDLSTATLALLPVAIAINIAVGAIVVALRLPIYLDSIGTVLVGVLAGPWAGALTGLLANLIWAILPVPGGAGPTIAFFAPVAAVIGLMAGFWAGRGAFRLRADDERVGGFLALAAGVAAAVVTMLVLQATVGLSVGEDAEAQMRFVLLGLVVVAVGVAVAWLSGRTVFRLGAGDPRVARYLSIATAVSAAALVFVVLRLLFAPDGYFSKITGLTAEGIPDDFLGGANLTGLALPDPAGLVGVGVVAVVVGFVVWRWVSQGERARLFPVWVGGLTTGIVAAAISAPIAAYFFGGVTGSGTDALVALFRTLGLNVFQSTFAQGLTSDPLDKTISYTIVFLILAALPLTVRTMFSRGETTIAD
jgi:energy-coupling factor transport system substrate-specific component